MTEHDIVFLGGVYPREIAKEVYEKSIGPVQSAANALQWNIIEGLDRNLSNPVNLLNLMFVGSYPKRYKSFLIKGFKFSHTKGAKDYNIAYCNLTIIKQLLFPLVLKIPIKKWIKEDNGRRKILIIYSVQDVFMNIAALVKRINNNIHICLIVPDLPAHMSMSKDNEFLYRYIKKRNTKRSNENMKFIDSFVLLTEQMSEYLHIIDKPYVVVEGMVNNEINNVFSKNINNNDLKVVLYAGTLTRKYGIINLLNAFRLIGDSDYRLVICGDGEAKTDIMELAKEDNRIQYTGLISRDEVLRYQMQATVLVNPRQNTEEYTKYSFPSKIMEYLVSGIPVICYKLDGVPQEYNHYLIYVDGNSSEALAQKIVEICSLSLTERKVIGGKNREFVLKNKNNIKQAKKILDMIKT